VTAVLVMALAALAGGTSWYIASTSEEVGALEVYACAVCVASCAVLTVVGWGMMLRG
jgi:hypothetical protein